MNNLLYLIATMIFFSCNEGSNSLSKQTEEETKPNDYSQLLKKFEDISFDTLKIDSKLNSFLGIELDSIDVVLLPTKVDKFTKEFPEFNISSPTGIFACYKFPIDSTRIALIARTPSEYFDPNSIKLFIYDKSKNEITNFVELADGWGDFGYSKNKESWIFKNNDKTITSLIWERNKYYDDEENPDKPTEITDYYFLVKLSNHKIDTISENSKELSKEYRKLLK